MTEKKQENNNTLIFDRKLLEEKHYWLQRLGGGPVYCAPRLDEPRPNVPGGRTERVAVAVSGELYGRITQLTKGAFLTGTVLLAALMACLHKYTGSPTVVVGTPSRKPETGSVNNALAIMEQLGPELTFRELLMRLRQTLLDAYANQRYPHDHLLKDLGWEPTPNRCPLFDVALVFDAIHDPLPALGNDITFSFSAAADGLSGWLIYNPELYRRDSMALLAGYFLNLLGAGVSDPTQTLGELRLLPDAELVRTLAGWNATQRDYPDRHNILDLVEEQAQKTPAAPALVYAGTSLSYREVLARAANIAAHLQSRQVGPEVLVGICLQDPLATLLAVLGVLKAGGAFLPLDPAYPDERLAYMVEDSGVALVIADPAFPTRIPAGAVAVLEPGELLGAEIASASSSQAGPESAAYVIYTSGSTGKPKGTVLRHRGLCNLARAQGRLFGVEPGSRVLQFASFSFDASVSEIFMALCSGAALHLATREEMLPGAPLLAVLREQRITHVTLPPSLLAVLPCEALPDLSGLIVAGEPCTAEIAEKWCAGRRFFNAYGPTEATVCATISAYGGSGRPLIGRPIDNTQVHILDAAGQPVPVGLPGELHIGGVGLAHEYLKRPELTGEKFIATPLGRLYKSGDLARWLPSGEIEFLGRIDHQVKVRGFRIEPDEIAANLAAHPQVQHAVVVVREDRPGEPWIVAYVVLADPLTPVEDLRRYLREKLPEYMHPSHLIPLAEFPLLPNGKIDRRALPSPDAVRKGAGGKGTLARDNIELALVQIWEEVLNLRPVGVSDDFFGLGGHSLLAVKLMSRIQQAFARKLPLDLLFSHPTVAALARALRQDAPAAAWSPLVALRPAQDGGRAPLFCVHPAGGRVLCYVKLAQALGEDQPVYGFQARGFETGQEPYADIREMAADYRNALKTVQPHGPYQILGWSGGAIVAFEIARQLQEAGDPVALLALVDAYAPSALPEHLTRQDDAELFKALLTEEVPSVPLDELRSYTSEELLAYVTQRLIEADIIPPDFGVTEVSRFFEVYKTNCRLAHSPIASAYRGKIRLFRAQGEEALQQRYAPDDSTLGWADCATEGADIRMVPGSHNSMMEDPHVAVLVEALGRFLG
ncbi:MAG: amino acid adenylation domain-containing protein [Sulfuricella sp.]|nr:amino acid adenylation domain-containing protein [Sulfuricella sp.]